MAGDSREAAQASDQARFGHRLVHAHQHRLEIGAGWCEPPGLIRASEIAQVAIRDAPPDRPAFRWAEAFLLQTSIQFAVVPGFEAFLGGQGLQASEDAVLPGTSLHQRRPVADERITRRIEVAPQTRQPHASLPVDIGAEVVADLAGGAHGGIVPDAEAFRVERPAECARTGWVGRAQAQSNRGGIPLNRGTKRSRPLIATESPTPPVYRTASVHVRTNRQRPAPVDKRVQQLCVQSAQPRERPSTDRNQINDLAEAWLGRQDSNLGMAVPKTAALPLGDAPSA